MEELAPAVGGVAAVGGPLNMNCAVTCTCPPSEACPQPVSNETVAGTEA